MTTALIISSMLCALLFSGCAARPPLWIPSPEYVHRLEQLPYIPGEFDCGRAALLVAHYREWGLVSKMIFTGSDRFTRYDFILIPRGHYTVIVLNPKTHTWHEIDPTWKRNIDGKVVDFSQVCLLTHRQYYLELRLARQYLENVLKGGPK